MTQHTHAAVIGRCTFMCKSMTESSFNVFNSSSTVAQFLLYVTVALSKTTLKFLCVPNAQKKINSKN